jgi:hypothetical protein
LEETVAFFFIEKGHSHTASAKIVHCCPFREYIQVMVYVSELPNLALELIIAVAGTEGEISKTNYVFCSPFFHLPHFIFFCFLPKYF